MEYSLSIPESCILDVVPVVGGEMVVIGGFPCPPLDFAWRELAIRIGARNPIRVPLLPLTLCVAEVVEKAVFYGKIKPDERKAVWEGWVLKREDRQLQELLEQGFIDSETIVTYRSAL